MRKMLDMRCAECGAVERDQYLDPNTLGTHECGGQWEKTTIETPLMGRVSAVHGDDIPGGIEIKHGVCWPDGTPRKFYSKSEIARAAKDAGLHNHVEHKSERGTDKSKHTSRWV